MADNLDPDTIRQLNDSLKSMNDSIQTMIPAMVLNTRMMQENAGMTKGSSKAMGDSKSIVNDYLNAITKKTKADQEAAESQKKINEKNALQERALGELVNGLKSFSNAIMSTTGGMSKYNQGIGGITNAASSFLKTFGLLGAAVGGVVKVLGFLVQAVNKQNDDILKASDTFSSFGNAGALSTTEIKNMGRAAGYSTEQLDSYAKLIKDVGPDLLALGTTVAQGTKVFGDLTTMNEDQLAYYRRLGITQEQYNKAQGDSIRVLKASGVQVTQQMIQSGQLRKITDSYVESLLVLESLTGKDADALKKSKEAAMASMNIQIDLAQQDEKIRNLKAQAIAEDQKGNKDRAAQLNAQAKQLEENRENTANALTVAKEKLSAEKLAALQSAIATGTWTELSAKYANTYPDLLKFAKGIKDGKIGAEQIGPYFAEGTKRAVKFYGEAGKLTNSLEFAGEHLEDFALLADQGGRSYQENVALSKKNLEEEKARRDALKKAGADPLLDLRSQQEQTERRARIAMDALGDMVRGPVVGALQSFMKALAWAAKGIAKMSDKLFGTNIAPLFESSDDVAEKMKGTSEKLKKSEEELTQVQRMRQKPEEVRKEAEENFKVAAQERDQKMILMEKAREAYVKETDASLKAQKQKELETATAEYNLAKTKADKEARKKVEIETLTSQRNLDKLKEKEAQLLKQKLDTEKELNEKEAKLIDKQVQEGKITQEEAYQRKKKLGIIAEKPVTAEGQSAVKEAIAGKESGGNYNIFAGDKPGTDNKLTEMSIADVMKTQQARPNERSAAGKYQFMASTLKGLTEKYKIDTSAKFDPAMQEKLADLLVQENQKALEASGETATAGNTYLAHFLGAKGASEFLKAMRKDPNAPASAGMSDAAIRNNPNIAYADPKSKKERRLSEIYAMLAGKVDQTVAKMEAANKDKKPQVATAPATEPPKDQKVALAGDNNQTDAEAKRLAGKVPPEKQAKRGGYFQGPDAGYWIQLHGEELVVPMSKEITKKLDLSTAMKEMTTELSSGGDANVNVLAELKQILADGFQKLSTNATPAKEDNETVTTAMLEKLDDIIDVMTSQHDTTKELLTYSRV